MFAETKEAGEVQQAPAKVLKLSEAMRIGDTLIGESRINYWNSDDCGCAIAAAWAGRGGNRKDFMIALNKSILHLTHLGVAMGESPELLQSIEYRHCGGESRLQIADWLEAQGY